MAPAYAMPRMLDRAGLTLQDFDYYEIHEAFAAQVLCTLKAWEDPAFCKEKLGRDKPLGEIDRKKLNVNGGSLAAAHPFAATGGRIVAGLAKQLHEDGKGRGVISICAAGGQGVVAILESAGEVQHERPLLADRQRARSADASPSSSGLPQPVALDRYEPGRAGRRRAGPHRRRPRRPARQGVAGLPRPDRGRTRPGPRARRRRSSSTPPGSPTRPSWSSCSASSTPASRRLQRSGRVVVLGTPPEQAGSARARTAQRALEGFTRSLGKEIGGRGTTAQLVYVAPGAEDQLDSTLRFLLSPRSAYVSGQVVRIGKGVAPTPEIDWERPLDGKVGAGHRRLARDRRRDRRRPSPATAPRSSASTCRRRSTTCAGRDRADRRRGDRPRHHRRRRARADRRRASPSGVDIVVHNAGVTKDRTIAKMPEERWAQLMEINLSSEERINDALLEAASCCAPTARIVCVSSMAGIAGNSGQTNYAASKAGVIGMVEALAPELAERKATINAVAPGFIETQMTAAMPIGPREAGRRINSLSQGGLPVDVAETIAWFASPASTGVNGNVVRVCGQSLLGA